MAVIQEAWIDGVSARRVDDLEHALGLSGISKSEVSKLCMDIGDRPMPSVADNKVWIWTVVSQRGLNERLGIWLVI